MYFKYLLCLVPLVLLVNSEDLNVGTTINGQLAYTEEVSLSAIPLKTRTKNVFFNDPELKTIRGISAIDKDKSSASVIITSGGVGSTFVNLRLKSERGSGLDYQVQIFV